MTQSEEHSKEMLADSYTQIMEPIQRTVPITGLATLWRKIWTGVRNRGAGRNPGHTKTGLETCCLRLERQREVLEGIGPALESQFLQIAKALENLPSQSERLTEASEHLLKLATGQGEGEQILDECLQHLEEPVAYLRRYQIFSREFLVTLAGASQKMESILADERAIQSAIAPLKHIRTLFRIRAAVLEPGAQSSFHSLTHEIENLQLQASSVLNHKFAMLKSNASLVKALRGRLSTMVEHQGLLLDQHQQSMDEAIKSLKADLERNSQKDIRLTQVAQGIRNETGQLVLSLQAQDILGQKCAHILSGIDGILKELRTNDGAKAPPDLNRVLKRALQGIRVESAQLRSLHSHMEETEDSLTATLRHIESQIAEVEGNCLTLSEFESVTAGATGLVQVLLETLQEIQTRIQSTVTSAKDAFESIRPIGGQADDATGTMRELHAQIKLIALNAQVRAAHLGAGTGLDVLAAHTAAIADETGRMSEHVAMGLDALTEQLNGLVAEFAKTMASGASLQEDWGNVAKKLESRLHHYRDRSLSQMQIVTSASEQMRSGVQEMQRHIWLKAMATLPMQTMLQSLQALSDLVSSLCIDTPEAIETAGLESSYTRTCTMEAEKQVQAEALAKDNPNNVLHLTSSTSPLAPGDGLDRSSLPSSSDPGGRGDSACRAMSPLPMLSVLAAGEESLLHKGATPPQEKELGNNVELF